jgi:hypothetical protein
MNGADATIPPDAADATSPASGGDATVPTDAAPDAADASALEAGTGGGDAGGTPLFTLSAAGTGRVFDGVGAISGGGGNSRYLIDYPEPYRSQILDYLFKPGVGANLQILKVEIGGDTNSTDGAEASHQRTQAETPNCARGYEWWLMQQAVARNPQIKLYALTWGAPSWVGSGTGSGESLYAAGASNFLTYVENWLSCAKTNGLAIHYVGGWNEDPEAPNAANVQGWFSALHADLQSSAWKNYAGDTIQVVGADNDWTVASDMLGNPTLAGAIDIIGAHYPCNGGDGSPANSCPSTAAAVSTGKPLWASENGSQDYNTGAAPMARAMNRDFIDGQMTAFINWPLIAALPSTLPFATDGVVVANQPWSGAYALGESLWVVAHTTQFTAPGSWHYVTSASGYFGGASSTTNASYVSLVSSNGTDYTVVVETTQLSAAQTFTYAVAGGLSTGAVHVWASNLATASLSDDFLQVTDVATNGGLVTFTLQPGYLYTFTTMTGGQGKGTAAGPVAAAFGLPYADSFESYSAGQQARFLADQQGSFEVQPCVGRSGSCVQQMDLTRPVPWHPFIESTLTPYTLIGDRGAWSDYTIQADVMIPATASTGNSVSPSVELIGRYTSRDYWAVSNLGAYYLRVDVHGNWSILRADVPADGSAEPLPPPTLTTLASGTATAVAWGAGTWHTIALTLAGSALSATVDGVAVGSANDGTYLNGPAGLAVGVSDGCGTPNNPLTCAWYGAQFDNLKVTVPAGESQQVSSTYQIVSVSTGKALDVADGGAVDGGALVQAATSGAKTQQWAFEGDGTGSLQLINVGTGLALHAPASGTAVVESAYGGAGDQAAAFSAFATDAGTYTLANANGLYVTAPPDPSVTLASPDGLSDQQWSLILAAGATAGQTYTIVNRASGLLLEVANQSTAPGHAVDVWTANGGANQQWRLAPALDATLASEGYFNLVNVNSGLVLDVPGGSALSAGTALDQWSANTGFNGNGANQAWKFVPASGYYVLESAEPTNGPFVVDTASTTAGANAVQNNPASGGPTGTQEWTLVPAN